MTAPRIVVIAPRLVLPRHLRESRDGTIYVDVVHRAVWKDGIRYEWGRNFGFKPVGFPLIAVLLASYPRVVERDDIYEYLWGDDEDGGPEDPRSCIALSLMLSRPRLAALGFAVLSEWGRGYRLEAISEQKAEAA